MKIVRVIIILLLIGIPLYMLFNKTASFQVIIIGASMYSILIIIGVYMRYFSKPPKTE